MNICKIFKNLDEGLLAENREFARSGLPLIKKCEFKLLGQSALLEARLKIELYATNDIDAYTNAETYVIERLSEILSKEGLHYDLLSSEIWMPEETVFLEVYSGNLVSVFRADPLHVVVSKALMAPKRNHNLLVEFLASSPSPDFFKLCLKYGVDLEAILANRAEDR